MTAPYMSFERIDLPPNFDAVAVENLAAALKPLRGKQLIIDASQVTRCTTLGLQFLIAVSRSWQNDGQEIELMNSPAGLQQAITTLGIPGTAISIRPESSLQ